MKALIELEFFVRAADSGSFSAAARSLDLSPAAASAAIKRLEAELQTRLFVRSTRSLRLTPDGERFLQHCRLALQALSDGEQALRGDGSQLRGQLQLSLPSDRIAELVTAAGLQVEALLGDVDGTPYSPASGSLLLVARRP